MTGERPSRLAGVLGEVEALFNDVHDSIDDITLVEARALYRQSGEVESWLVATDEPPVEEEQP